MSGVLQQLPRGAAVAVIRLRSLGDCVLTTPALEILHQFRPDLRLSVVVEDRFSPVFAGSPLIDSILPPSIEALRRSKPVLCLNLHGGTRSLNLTMLSGARFRAGFAHFRYAAAYNIRIPTAQQILGVDRKVHTAEHLASAMFHLGASRVPIPRARLYAAPEKCDRPYVVIHPVAAAPEKTWRADGFLEVARHLQSVHGLQPLFIAGPGEDLSAFAQFRTAAGMPLERVKSLIAAAALFVGNDSGPAHMAAAFGVPVVVLFGTSDPIVWAPWQVESEVLTGRPSIHDITPESVIDATDRLRVAQ